MNGSTISRWGRTWLAGAGLACLGAGCFLVEGCTSATMVDMKAAVKTGPQVAKKGITDLFQGRKDPPRQQLAAKDAPGHARLSDLDADTTARLAQQKAPPKSGGTKLASGTTRPNSKDRLDVDENVAEIGSARAKTANTPARSVTNTQRPVAPKSRTTKVAANDFDPDLDEFSPEIEELPASPARASKPLGNSVAAAKRRAPVKNQTAKTAAVSVDPDLEIDGPSVTQLVDELEPADELPPGTRRATAQQKKTDRAVAARTKLASEESAPETEKVAGSPHERRRADQLMQRAYSMYRSGYPEEALRLASVAVELEKSQQAKYGRGEERPSDFITWLQSGDAANIPAAPVITPQPRLDRRSDDAIDSDDLAIEGIETTSRRRPVDIKRGTAGRTILSKANPVNEPVNAARSNAGLSLSPSEGPGFPVSAATDRRAIANAGQLEVPPVPTTRSAEVSAIAAAPEAPAVDSPAMVDAPPSVASVAVASAGAAPKAGVTHLVMRSSAAVPPPVEEVRDDSDSIGETEVSALSTVRTSQVTIVSLIGLIAGVAGMFGLSWWRIQESRHFATSK